MTVEEAQEAVAAPLPVDAERLESPYEAPPPPCAWVALRAWRYVSPTLGTVPYGGTTTLPPEILVVYHLTHADETPAGADQRVIETSVTRVSIMTRLPEG